MTWTNTHGSKRVNVKILRSGLMWAYFELLRLYTNVWVEPINFGTLG